VAINSTARGPSLGGCRLWTYPTVGDAVSDALRLSRAMTLKAAVAGLPLGGGKGVIMRPVGEALSRSRRHQALLDFAELVESLGGRYIAAEDVGTSSRDMSVIAQRTGHVAGLSRRLGGSGDPSPSTALGVLEAIRASCEVAFGEASLAGRSVCVLGLGHVGSRVARLCLRAGAAVTVSDLDLSLRASIVALGARWIDPRHAIRTRVDVLVPCALGGLLTERSVPTLRCRAVAGAANNQLQTDAVARLLARRQILWAPDFVANAGGLINIAAEIGGYDPVAARSRIRSIGDTLRRIYDHAAHDRITPLAAAMLLAEANLQGSGPDLPSAG
jgi:leucine dehydrogenase